jgi:hypothetical protein
VIESIHERRLTASPEVVGELLDSLASENDRLWPHRRWPAMRLDKGLAPGSRGGHGPVRYEVARYEPGRLAAFAFTSDFGIAGEHRCEVIDGPAGTTLLRHTLEGRPTGWMRLGWPLAFRWLHDALIEDAFDRAEAQVKGERWTPASLPSHVRLLRWILTRKAAPAPHHAQA